jgi:hypothetical protein
MHAMFALLTGGRVYEISLNVDESGLTQAAVGNTPFFLFIVSAGYVGTSFLGALFLHTGLTGKKTGWYLFFLGLVLLLLVYNFSIPSGLAFQTGIFWGFIFLVVSVSGNLLPRIFSIFLGTALAIYSVYDLKDFTHTVHLSDAMLLSAYLFNQSYINPSKPMIQLSYIIAGIWSSISITSIFFILLHSIKYKEAFNDAGFRDIQKHIFSGRVNLDVAEWFIQKGIDLNGKPLSKELLEEINKYSKKI